MKKAKIFVCHHPARMVMYKNLAKMAKNKDTDIILFKVKHLYFESFDFKPFEKYFDKVVELDFLAYDRNIVRGYLRIIKFHKDLKKALEEINREYKEVDAILIYSAWLPINFILFNLGQQKNIKNIIKITSIEPQGSKTKESRLMTSFANLYTLPFKCYEVGAITTLGGKFLDFYYKKDNLPGINLKVVNPHSELLEKREDVFPFPIVPPQGKKKKDIIIVFGDTGISEFYSEYIPDKEKYLDKKKLFFNALEKKYKECKLYYKPHPTDGDKFMKGIDKKKYQLFSSKINSEMIFDQMADRIKAVYSISSTSLINSSYYSIPSYSFYRYLFNKEGKKKWDEFFNQPGYDSPFIYHLEKIEEIGKIDKMEEKKIDQEKDKKMIINKLKL